MSQKKLQEQIARAIYTSRNGQWDYKNYRSQAETYREDAKAVMDIIDPLLADMKVAVEAFNGIIESCQDWRKYRDGKWKLDCDEPPAVIECYDLASTVLTRLSAYTQEK